MDTLIKDILQKLKLTISLELLNPDNSEYEKVVYREIAAAKTMGMLLEAIKKLPPEKMEKLKEKLEPKTEITYKMKEKHQKRLAQTLFSVNFNENKKHPRLIMLEEIKKRKTNLAKK